MFFSPLRPLTIPKNKTSISCSSLNLLNLNVRSLEKHLEDLEALAYSLESPPADILCLTETWLSEKDDPKLFFSYWLSESFIESS